jgi:hypothetical protein
MSSAMPSRSAVMLAWMGSPIMRSCRAIAARARAPHVHAPCVSTSHWLVWSITVYPPMMCPCCVGTSTGLARGPMVNVPVVGVLPIGAIWSSDLLRVHRNPYAPGGAVFHACMVCAVPGLDLFGYFGFVGLVFGHVGFLCCGPRRWAYPYGGGGYRMVIGPCTRRGSISGVSVIRTHA